MISKNVDASIEEFKHSIKEMNFLYKVLKGTYEDGKEAEAKALFETIKKVVDENNLSDS